MHSQITTQAQLPLEVHALLQQSGAMVTPHTGRTLHAHLMGTYQQLQAWGNPQAVCMAGLFHSIYGTNAFTHQSLLQTQRAELQQAIGQEAETLAWLFCSIDRPRAILQGLQTCKPGGSTQLKARRMAGDSMQLERTCAATYAQLQALAEMECANLIEQGSWSSALRELYCAAIDNTRLLSDGALAALRSGLSNKIHQQQRQAA